MFDLERDEDLARQILSEADRRLMAVYGGDSVHQNDGRTMKVEYSASCSRYASCCASFASTVAVPVSRPFRKP